MPRARQSNVPRGRAVPIVWNGSRLRAWAPLPLAGQDLSLGPRAIRLTERAAAAVVAAGEHAGHFGPLAPCCSAPRVWRPRTSRGCAHHWPTWPPSRSAGR